jgi:hypothetical protein
VIDKTSVKAGDKVVVEVLEVFAEGRWLIVRSHGDVKIRLTAECVDPLPPLLSPEAEKVVKTGVAYRYEAVTRDNGPRFLAAQTSFFNACDAYERANAPKPPIDRLLAKAHDSGDAELKELAEAVSREMQVLSALARKDPPA